jgi:hypothetical protein
MDLALGVSFGFGFGLLARGTYVTNFVESGEATNEVLQEKAILS